MIILAKVCLLTCTGQKKKNPVGRKPPYTVGNVWYLCKISTTSQTCVKDEQILVFKYFYDSHDSKQVTKTALLFILGDL